MRFLIAYPKKISCDVVLSLIESILQKFKFLNNNSLKRERRDTSFSCNSMRRVPWQQHIQANEDGDYCLLEALKLAAPKVHHCCLIYLHTTLVSRYQYPPFLHEETELKKNESRLKLVLNQTLLVTFSSSLSLPFMSPFPP